MSVSLSSELPATIHMRTALQTDSLVMPERKKGKRDRQSAENESELIRSPLKMYEGSLEDMLLHTAEHFLEVLLK